MKVKVSPGWSLWLLFICLLFLALIFISIMIVFNNFHSRYRVHDRKSISQPLPLALLFAEFWMRALFASPTWNSLGNFRAVVDAICQSMFFVHGGRSLVQNLLREQFDYHATINSQQGKGWWKSMFAGSADNIVILSIAEAVLSFFFCDA